jgi:thymidylate synthase ThyX
MTANLRQWRWIFQQRALNKHAQWQIRGLMQSVLIEFGKALPEVFGDQLLQINSE